MQQQATKALLFTSILNVVMKFRAALHKDLGPIWNWPNLQFIKTKFWNWIKNWALVWSPSTQLMAQFSIQGFEQSNWFIHMMFKLGQQLGPNMKWALFHVKE